MKFVLLFAILVAHVSCQDVDSHFRARGFDNRPQSTSPLSQSSQSTFNQEPTVQVGRGRSQSRFTNTQSGQQFLNQQNSQQAAQNHFSNAGQRTRTDSVRTVPGSSQTQNTFSSQTQPARAPQRTQPARAPQPAQPTRPTQQSSSSNSNKPSDDSNSSGRLLDLPQPHLCATRPKQWQFGGRNYYFSWDQEKEIDPATGQTVKPKVDWLKARNECRKRCMDSIGIESEAEHRMVVKFLQDRNITYVWTSGRLCDFKGCEQRKDLKPLNVLGWFWSNTNTKTAPTNATPPGWSEQPWSQKGHKGGPQPDNAEFDINKTSESCLGVLNNIYKDGIKWHDIACYHKKPFICEDSELLLNYIKQVSPDTVL